MPVIKQSPSIDFSDTASIQSFQFDLLKKQLMYVASHSPYYQQLFNMLMLHPENMDSWEHFRQIPITSKDDFSRHNENFLCINRNEIADFSTTSGTTGSPISFYLNTHDLDRLAKNEAYSMLCAGCTSEDVFQLMTTMDKRFMAGLAYYLGIQKMGAGIVRNGPGALSLQWDSILRYQPTVLIAVPGFIPDLIRYAIENDINYRNSSVKKIICIGQPIRNEMLELNDLGKAITEKWNVQLHSTYASTEMAAAFTECEAGKGGHLPTELLYLEVLDENGNHVLNGQAGEVVITTLGVEAMPLIRYATGDICNFYNEPCSCGRHTPRLGPVVGRKNQLLKVKGTSVFPNSIYAVLDVLVPENSYYVVVEEGDFLNDVIRVAIDSVFAHKQALISEHLQSKLRFLPDIQFIESSEVAKKINDPEGRKIKKFFDQRRP